MIRKTAVFLLLALCAAGLAVAGTTQTENFNEGVVAPYLIPESRVSPAYPQAAYDARLEGTVTAAALVLKDGSVAYVEMLDTSHPNLGFEAAAEAAIRQWEFEPASKDGEIVDAFTVVRLSFRRGGRNDSGYVTAGFAPLGALGASIVAQMGAPTGVGNGSDGFGLTGSIDPERGGYHPVIPKGLAPGDSYHRDAYWPQREFNLGDLTAGGTNALGAQDK
jgi:TonB family protein